jgi:hypothetical protein
VNYGIEMNSFSVIVGQIQQKVHQCLQGKERLQNRHD